MSYFKENCKQTNSNQSIGICDDPPPSERPAYLDTSEENEWITEIENPEEKEVTFYAIDNCIKIIKPNTEDDKESTCDGVFIVEKDLTFVELKDRNSKRWLKKAREQIENTHRLFKNNKDLESFEKIDALVSNKQRPQANVGNMNHIQQFKDNTGLTLRVQRKIKI
ncbi:hypothetical protein [Aureivirga sp. CE67]|uniref:hypothetical protein n=1 Tax=Aureivirga sp. CE67 TaxID=1788983 RepID=UPI0018CA39E9|nr:hypothetical protein [Aureivirga sp. CE67]